MSKTLSRAPFILAHPGDMSGCGYYRIIKPIEALSRAGYATARIEQNFVPQEFLPNLDPDVVVWQRQNEAPQIEAMKRYRELLPNAFFVFENDDALGSVPEASYHHPFMSPTVDDRVGIAAGLCDVITVTTEGLKTHMEKLCPGKPVRIAPNMLSREDLKKADAVPRALDRPMFRVGWGGGMGHAGDLALLEQAMVDLADEVMWVFIGYKPENIPPEVSYEYRDAVAPGNYIEALAGLDVDVIVAPLENNHFNFCKSNLRIIEAGACRFPVIATPFGPYLTKRPPVEYAESPEAWTLEIRRMARLTPAGRKQKADDLRSWVERNYLFDDRIAERLSYWLPDDMKPYAPRRAKRQGHAIARTPEQLRAYCADSNFDVTYVRHGVTIDDALLDAMADRAPDEKVATVSVVTNDGGPAGFPVPNNFAPVPDYVGETLHELAAAIGGTAPLTACSGPVILLSRQALNIVGQPDFARWPHPEMAILEWAISATHLGFTNSVDLGVYVRVEQPLQLSGEIVHKLSLRCGSRWPTAPANEKLLVAFREMLELRFHRTKFRQMQPQDPTNYAAWTKRHDKLGLAGMEACHAWWQTTAKPPVDVVAYTDKPLTRADLGDVTPGRWKLFLPQHATPAQTCIAHAVEAIESHPETLVFYGDHDFAPDGVRGYHDFKPNFDLHLLLSRDYVSQAMLVRAETASMWLGDIDAVAPASCQLYAWALEAGALEQHSVGLIRHIPRIMAHLGRPTSPEEAAFNAEAAQNIALERGWPVRIQQHAALKVYNDVHYIPPLLDTPSVEIIIPTKNNLEMIVPCLATLLRTTNYPNFRVLVIDNGSTDEDVLEYFANITDERVTVLRHEVPFNWAAINNYAVTQTNADVYCFLNDDTRVLEPQWLTEMVGAAYFPGVGAVGARLSFPHNFMQHIGIVSSHGNSGHMQIGIPSHYAGYNGIAALSHEATAVTGACMVVRNRVFKRVGGFNELLKSNFNDVAFCLDLRKLGHVNVVPAGAHLQHVAGATRRSLDKPEHVADAQAEVAFMRERYRQPDPYWNPNLMFGVMPDGMTAIGTNMDVMSWPPMPNPWEAAEFSRVMVVGDLGVVASEVQDKDAIYHVLLQGNAAQIVDPPLPNVQPFDLRDPDSAMPIIQELGIDKIIIGGLEYGSTLLLSWITRLGIPVEYRPRTAEAVCPLRTLRRNGEHCASGWKQDGECQHCVDIHGSPNGYVTIESWRADWKRFINRSNVTTQLEYLENPNYADALGNIFGANSLEDLPIAEDIPAA